jgi:hypothetical protein
MKFRNCVAIASLLVLAAPLPVAFCHALLFFALTPDASLPGLHDKISGHLVGYISAISIGFVGFILAGFCLDGFGMRPRWYLRSLWVIGVLWLFYFPAGTVFGACLLFYLLMKGRSGKAGSEALKSKMTIPVVLTRDSVCAGDDGDAPYEKTIEVQSLVDPEAFAREVSSGYLPSVAGVGHSWTCVLNGVRIAEITTSGIRTLVRESPFSKDNRAHFVYHSATF